MCFCGRLLGNFVYLTLYLLTRWLVLLPIFAKANLQCVNAGGTIVHVLNDIVSRGGNVNNMIVVCVVACPPALKQLSEKFVGKLRPATI